MKDEIETPVDTMVTITAEDIMIDRFKVSAVAVNEFKRYVSQASRTMRPFAWQTETGTVIIIDVSKFRHIRFNYSPIISKR